VVIPRLQKRLALLARLSDDLAEFARRITEIDRDREIAQPDFRFLLRSADMDKARVIFAAAPA
jgi:hypothetical protein